MSVPQPYASRHFPRTDDALPGVAGQGAFALLDDSDATAAAPTSRLYTGCAALHVCRDPAAFDAMWCAVDAELAQGLHAVLLADYDWGAALLDGYAPVASADAAPALRVLTFRDCRRLALADADAWLAATEGTSQPGPAGFEGMRASTSRSSFGAAIARIHQALADGEVYQVNYTYRMTAAAYGAPLSLYRRMRRQQPVRHGALIALPDPDAPDDRIARWVLSCSPELFVAHDAGQLTTRPMKGTAPRAARPADDTRMAEALAADPKNRAENLMIVDLLRNDLGRIADVGSVRVPQLFHVESYPTVHQMTSTVTATLPPSTGFPTLLRALFPCGSITGAPKRRAVGLIRELEPEARGLYTGSIGWIDPRPDATRACPPLCLSVAIRTVVLDAPSQRDGGRWRASLGVGGGVVVDSTADGEYREARLKARFVTALDPGFMLFETLRATQRGGPVHMERHLQRLAHSAQRLGFVCDRDKVARALRDAAAALPQDVVHRLRLRLHHAGDIDIAAMPAEIAPTARGPVRLLLAHDEVPPHEAMLLMHKTTARSTYDANLQRARDAGCFDMLHFNRRDQLTEGARSNVFVRLDGRWCTPPVSCGLLPGVMRAALLGELHALQRPITRHDLARAEDLRVCNAVYGALPAVLDTAVPGPVA